MPDYKFKRGDLVEVAFPTEVYRYHSTWTELNGYYGVVRSQTRSCVLVDLFFAPSPDEPADNWEFMEAHLKKIGRVHG